MTVKSKSSISHYEVLGVPVDASTDEIKLTYRKMLLTLHPDKSKTVPIDSTIKIRSGVSINQIQEAYRVLSNDQLRAAYNRALNDSNKLAGFNNFGDGLDEFNLDEFEFNEEKLEYVMTCPRCQSGGGFVLSEDMLEECIEDGLTESEEQGYQVLTQCTACSLWLKVNFFINDEEE
ncbi:hypothetical protein B1J92_C04565g [Nakaseomyces glabratus]|nr:hypothetical protein B1J91_C04565g [Nakaseomyces glabratus]OXB50302.1 hypothetical protein B1J92_C04565g [Nakaseomyces glabratus]